MIQTSLKGSNIYQSKCNASIYQSGKGSIYASAVGSFGGGGIGNSNDQSDIFESVIEGNANKFEQPNMDLFQSAREDDILINSFNELIDYDFFYMDIHIVKISNNSNNTENNDNLQYNNTRFANSVDFSKLIDDCNLGRDKGQSPRKESNKESSKESKEDFG